MRLANFLRYGLSTNDLTVMLPASKALGLILNSSVAYVYWCCSSYLCDEKDASWERKELWRQNVSNSKWSVLWNGCKEKDMKQEDKYLRLLYWSLSTTLQYSWRSIALGRGISLKGAGTKRTNSLQCACCFVFWLYLGCFTWSKAVYSWRSCWGSQSSSESHLRTREQVKISVVP